MRIPYLFINTVNEKRPSFLAFNNDGYILYSYKFVDKQEDLARELNSFLKKEKIQLAKIRAMLVISGPGSFSASRAGVVLANSFNFVDSIPILSVKDAGGGTEELVKNNLHGLKRIKKTAVAEVYYQKEPKITIK